METHEPDPSPTPNHEPDPDKPTEPPSLDLPPLNIPKSGLFSVPIGVVKAHLNAGTLKPAEDLKERAQPEISPDSLTPEALNQKFQDFLMDTFTTWNKDTAPNAIITPQAKTPDTINYEDLSQDVDAAKFGQYLVNPETLSLDYEPYPKDKLKVLDLSNLVDKPLHEVMTYLLQNYPPSKYYYPGLDFIKWLRDTYPDPNTIPPDFKAKYQDLYTGKYYFLPGSLVRRSYGHWDVPCFGRADSEWRRDGRWLGRQWYSNYRMVLLEK